MTVRRSAYKGFTLIEILMALTIMLVGVVGIYAVFAVGLVSHKRAVDHTAASNLAASLFDDIAANYDVWYFDNDRNGVPDLAERDRNNNGIGDLYDVDNNGRPLNPIPFQRGYRYTIRYERNPAVPQELLVMVHIYWRQAGEERAEPFQRSIFIKDLPALDR
ncbi:MAG: prepilin-type N-terminal cleavage/methylation domain-containing protein [Planctomycetes bacterium]|nr:prepilin-type N-terminal cleavage/methylation domain-containing protein [Planctomycetota bacterium]MCW8135234.1 prepilin-type N-terminal cleavage/methylation domain-containing protein [Planctomycetota bacterium]